VFRETILPKVELEVNAGPTFGLLRQIQSIMVFSAWLRRSSIAPELAKRGYLDCGDTSKYGLDRITADKPLRIQAEYQKLVREGSWQWAETREEGGGLV